MNRDRKGTKNMATAKKAATPAPAKKSDAAEYITFRGKSMYARVFEPMGPPPQDPLQPPRWTVDVLIDNATKIELTGKGIRIKDSNPRFDAFVAEQGLVEKGYDGSYVTVKKSTVRKQYNPALQEVVKDSTGAVVMEPAPRPKVTDSAGNEIPESADLKIGNGSDVEVCGTVTKAIMARPGNYGMRLVSTKILNLIPYIVAPQGTFVYGDAPAVATSEDAPAIAEYDASVEALDPDDMPY